MRLWLRIFLASAGLVMLTLLAYAVWQQQLFASGFADYLDRIAREQAERAAPRLAAAYQRSGGWDFLRADPMRLGMVMDGHDERRPPPANVSPPPSSSSPPPPPPDMGAGAPPARPPGPEFMGLDFGRRLRLVDVHGQYIAGARAGGAANLAAVPVRVDGVEVGRIEIMPLPVALRESPENEFASTQLRLAGLAALLMLLPALLLAWVFARWLLRPVQELAQGTQVLATGDFSRRIPVRGDDELASLTRDFNRMTESLERHQRERQRWGQDIAHELRTPLTILQAELQTLIDGVRPTTPEALASLLAECERLSRLVDELRELASADDVEQYPDFVPLDLRELAEAAIDTQRGSLAAAGLEIELKAADEPFWVRGDDKRLMQLLRNLLLNSARYTDAPGRIELSLQSRPHAVLLCLADSAPGVSDADLPHLFDRLYRADPSRHRATGGSGLGLAICQAIVKAHGGEIEARHSRLGGLEIQLRLPKLPEEP